MAIIVSTAEFHLLINLDFSAGLEFVRTSSLSSVPSRMHLIISFIQVMTMIVDILAIFFSLSLIRIVLVLIVAFSYSSVVDVFVIISLVLSGGNFLVSGNILEQLSDVVCLFNSGRLILIPRERGDSTNGG